MSTSESFEKCLDVLSVASTDNEKFAALLLLESSSSLAATVPYLNEILIVPRNENENNGVVDMIKDALDCVSCFIETESGLNEVVEKGTVGILASLATEENDVSDIAFLILQRILCKKGSSSWDNSVSGLHIILNHFCLAFSKDKTLEKFEICSKLVVVLATVQKNHISNVPGNWTDSLHSTLSEILQCEKQRQPAIELVSLILDLEGITWTLGKDGKQSKMLLLLVHLTCIEVRMALEEHSILEVEPKAELLTACFTILENVVQYLTVSEPLSLSSKQIQQVHAAMMGAFNAIIYFLKSAETENPHGESNNLVLSPVVMACVRVLGCWIAEESSALKDEVVEILPFLLKICKRSLGMDPLLALVSKSDNSSNKNSQLQDYAILRRCHENQSHSDLLKFLLPGLSHLTADETGRQCLLNNGLLRVLGNYFSLNWQNCRSGEKYYVNPAAEASLTITCHILLNIVVTERESVAKEPFYAELMRLLVAALTEIEHEPSQIMLSYNMAALSLMILRDRKDSSGLKVREIERLFGCCIRLLSQVHAKQAPKKKSMASLTVSILLRKKWDLIQEMWFLAMQALVPCVTSFPCVCKLILKSGWLQQLVNLLIHVKGNGVDVNTSVCYRNLLLCMTRENETARKVVREAGGMELARIYNLEQLKTILSESS